MQIDSQWGWGQFGSLWWAQETDTVIPAASIILHFNMTELFPAPRVNGIIPPTPPPGPPVNPTECANQD